MRVVCDSSALIGLTKIGKLDILKEVFGEVYIPNAVFDEVASGGRGKPGAKEILAAKWVRKKAVQDRRTVEILIAELGHGEAEVLVLGKEMDADLLILDDEKARAALILWLSLGRPPDPGAGPRLRPSAQDG